MLVFAFGGVLVSGWVVSVALQVQLAGALTWGVLLPIALPRCGLHIPFSTHGGPCFVVVVLGTWSGLLPSPCPSACGLAALLGAFSAHS